MIIQLKILARWTKFLLTLFQRYINLKGTPPQSAQEPERDTFRFKKFQQRSAKSFNVQQNNKTTRQQDKNEEQIINYLLK